MLKRMMVFLVMLLLLAPVAQATHPILHLTPGDGTIRPRGHNYDAALNSWCSRYYSSYNLNYISETRYCSKLLAMSNFALAYQLDPMNATKQLWARKAIDLWIARLADPPADYNSLTDWMRRQEHYPARNALYGCALTYDWTYNFMTPGERYKFRRAMVVELKRFYAMAHIAQLSQLGDSLWASNHPHDNYYYGDLLGELAACIAVREDTVTAGSLVDTVYTYLVDTMVVQAKRAKFANASFITKFQDFSNATGRDVGGISMEATSYGANDNEYYGLIIDMLARVNAASVASYARDQFARQIVAQIYATYPGKTFDGEFNMIGEGTSGNGGLGVTEASAVKIATSLCSNADTAGVGLWWINHVPVLDVEESSASHLFEWVLFDTNIPEVHPSLLLTTRSYYCSGPQYLFIRGGNDIADTRDGMLLTLRGGMANTDHAQSGFGNITWYKGGYLIADPALLGADGEEDFVNDYFHNTVAIDTSRAYKGAWRMTPHYGASVLDNSATNATFIYYDFNMTSPYTSQPSYMANTVVHKEREFAYFPQDTLLFLFDRATTYGHRVCVSAGDNAYISTTAYIYPITWSLYTEGAWKYRNSAFTSTPKFGPYKLAGMIATPDTNVAHVMSVPIKDTFPITAHDLHYEQWVPDSAAIFSTALWAGTEATYDSLFRVNCDHGRGFGVGASTKHGTTWVDIVPVFSTTAAGDTCSIFPSATDSLHVNYGRPADSVYVYVFDLSPSDSFWCKSKLHRADTLQMSVKRTKTTGYTKRYSSAAGVLTVPSASTGSSPEPPRPPSPHPTKGGKDPRIAD